MTFSILDIKSSLDQAYRLIMPLRQDLDHDIPYSSNLFVWSIPLAELQTNNTAPIEQNPGY